MIDYERGKGFSNDVDMNVMLVTGDDPVSFLKAIKRKKWRDTIIKEIKSIQKNKT